jgi:amino acid adenylation domain-containing protein/FkbM family methyltransferase
MTVHEELLARLLQAEGLAQDHGAEEVPKARDGEPPVPSFAQQRLWFLDRLDPGNPQYDMVAALRIRGPLDRAALVGSLDAIVARHEALRTVFPEGEDGRPAAEIRPPRPLDLPVVDLAGLPPDMAEDEILREMERAARHEFDLAAGPLVRGRLLDLGADHHVLLLCLHHIVSDGWSMGILVEELGVLYPALASGKRLKLPPLPLQYPDFAAWQRERLRGEYLEDLVAGWREALAEAPPILDLPADRPRPALREGHGSVHRFDVGPGETAALRDLARREGVTLFMLLLAAFQTFLSRITGERRIVTASSVANRTRPEIESLIGFFVNILPLHTDLGGDPPFTTLLRRVRETTLDAYDRQELPFDYLVERLAPPRDPRFGPLCQVFFALQQPLPIPALPGLEVELLDVPRPRARYDLYLDVHQVGDRLRGEIEYPTDLFDAATIARFSEGYRTLLDGVLRDPEAPISTLPLLSEEEREEAWGAGLGPRLPLDRVPLVARWLERVERDRDARAVSTGEAWCTFGDLDRRRQAIVARLQRVGIGPGDPVAVLVDRGPDLVASLLAVWTVGAVYVPLDPSAPARHHRAQLVALGIRVLVGDPEHVETALPGAALEVVLVATAADGADEAPSPPTELSPDAPALVVFTSGSTGAPKPVVVPHQQLLNRFAWMWSVVPFDEGETACQRTSQAFSVSLWETLGPLLRGVPLLVLPDAVTRDAPRLVEALARHRVTRIVVVPSILRMLLDADVDLGLLSSLRVWSVCGEVLPPDLCRRFFDRLPGARLLHQYGATEMNDVAWHEVRPGDLGGDRVPLGRPIANTEIHVLDERLEPVPAGVPGDLYVAGPGLAQGYPGHPGETAAAFLPHPRGWRPGSRIYRTGDRGRRVPDGHLELWGRRDAVVKIRGVRVDPAGVESVLSGHPAVQQAVVTSREDGRGSLELVAHVLPAPGRGPTHRDRPRYRLPNGLAVVHLNRNETDFLYRELFEGHTYRKQGITYREGDVVLDVGANIGLFTLFAHQQCGRARILAFEPNPAALEALRANVALYGVDAEILDVGLSTAETTARFTFYPKFTFMSGLYADAEDEKALVRSFLRKQGEDPDFGPSDASAELLDELLADRFEAQELDVRLTRLSTVLRERSLDRIDLLKVNVEKAELDVLEGIDDEHWPAIRQVVLQVHDLDDRRRRVEELLRRQGFAYTTVRDWAVEEDQEVYYVYAHRPPRRPTPATAAPTPSPLPPLDDATLRAWLRERLPEASVPAHVRLLEELPRTPSGKPDRVALAAQDPLPGSPQVASEGPRSEVERRLAEIVAEILTRDRVGIHDSFFDLGGHSLLATRVMARIRQELSVELPLPTLFENPTVAGLARVLERHRLDLSAGGELALSDVLATVEALTDDEVREAMARFGHADLEARAEPQSSSPSDADH